MMKGIKTLFRNPKAYFGYNVVKVKTEKGRTLHALKKERPYKAQMQQDELKTAISAAEDPDNPNRRLLYGIYRETFRDRHLRSQIRTNIFKVVGSPFAIFKKGTDTIDEAMTIALTTRWFEKYRVFYHETPWWSHSLVEFQEMVVSDKDGLDLEFKEVKLFPREHVIPERGWITIYPHDDSKVIPFRKPPFNRWIMEMGEPDDIGLLSLAAEEVIWKKYSRSDWSRSNEKYGMPLLSIKTATRNEKELDELEDMATNFGSNGYVILDDNDEVEIKEPTKRDGYKAYKEKVLLCNEEMSKLVSGQTLTSGTDGKGSYALGEVHENILSEYVEAAMRSETYHINDDLFPFLIGHGYPLNDREFRYLAFMKKKEEREANPGEQEPGKDKKLPPGKTVNFIKPSGQAIPEGGFSGLVNHLYYGQQCCTGFDLFARGPKWNAEKYAEAAAERIWHKKLKAGGIDKDLWIETVRRIWQGIYSGYGKKWDAIKYGSRDHSMLLQLRYNVHVWSAFKNHHNINELVKALVDENGEIRSFSQFKKAAGMINEKYNKNWIRTEYNQAVLSAQNAANWQRFEKNKAHLPNLRYVAVLDERVTSICKGLHGTIRPVDDPFWDTYAPSNHWGCRSRLVSTRSDANGNKPDSNPQKGFRDNPGKSGHPFSKDHPYYTIRDQYKDAAERLFNLPLPISSGRIKENIQAFELLDSKTHKLEYTNVKSGGFVASHVNAHSKDYPANLKAAKVLARENGDAVVIREHLEDGTPNPEFKINGILSDLKATTAPYSLDSRLQRAAKRQGLKNIVWELTGKHTLDNISKGLRRGFHNRSTIDWVYVLYQGKALKITREHYERNEILWELRKIWT